LAGWLSRYQHLIPTLIHTLFVVIILAIAVNIIESDW
jgi:hypothetical protein